jgi:hypothetical protein
MIHILKLVNMTVFYKVKVKESEVAGFKNVSFETPVPVCVIYTTYGNTPESAIETLISDRKVKPEDVVEVWYEYQ